MSPRDQSVADARYLCSTLTPRQRDVLVLTCKGLTTDEIADLLGITYHTVGTHRETVLSKFDVRNTVEAAVIATKAGLV